MQRSIRLLVLMLGDFAGVTVNKSSAEQRQQIAEHLKVPIEKVTNWFRNNRLTSMNCLIFGSCRSASDPTLRSVWFA